MSKIASQITSLTIVYSTVYSGPDQTKHQSSASLAFVRGIHRGPVNSPHKWPVTRKMFPLDDVIMIISDTGLLSVTREDIHWQQYWLKLLIALDPWKEFSVKFELHHKNFQSRKFIWKFHLQIGSHFVSASMHYGLTYKQLEKHQCLIVQWLLMALVLYHQTNEMILGLCQANERRRYFVTSLIGWAQG